VNQPIGKVNIPPPPNIRPDHLKTYSGLARAVSAIAEWHHTSSRYLNKKLNEFQEQSNTQVQGVGATIASTATITVSAAIHHITGANTITTINAPAGFSGPVHLLADGAFSLGIGGNINLARGPYSVGQVAILVYDPATAMWSPN
jgi:hypothetical protein